MANTGEMLREARERKGVSLEEAEEETKVRARYLAALENEEYDVIPGKAYVKGFLKIYANYLGLNPDEVILQYKSSQIALSDQVVPKQPPQRKKYKRTGNYVKKRTAPKWKTYTVTALLAMAAIVTLVVFNGQWSKQRVGGENNSALQENNINLSNDQGKNASPQKPGEKSATPQPNHAANNTPAGNPGNNNQIQKNYPQVSQNQPNKNNNGQATDGVNVVLKTKDQNCWVKVVIDGQTAYTGTLMPGQIKSFDGKEEIRLVLGNAGAVEVIYNGQNLGTLGPIGQVVKDKFPRSM